MAKLPNFHSLRAPKIRFGVFSILISSFTLIILLILSYSIYQNIRLSAEVAKLNILEEELNIAKTELSELKARDEYVINTELESEIENINKTYKDAILLFGMIDDYGAQGGEDDAKFKEKFAAILNLLSERNYSSASAEIVVLDSEVESATSALIASRVSVASVPSAVNVAQSNTPPGSGYSRQSVSALDSTYVVDIVAADLGSTRVIVDTASGGDCGNDCPVLSLSDYVGRNGAFAGVNGSYFCPASYPACAGKTNSFDTLLMNKDKVYFNSENNVYSNVPAVIFLSGGIRFVGASSQWGRDTGVDGVLANQPLLLSGGNIAFGGNDDPKQGSKGTRSFVGSRGNTVYIGVVHNVTVAEMAHVLAALGLENALNLDSGGSVALWANGGYRAGPGRNIPNAILFIGR